jgi:hypothetical protein
VTLISVDMEAISASDEEYELYKQTDEYTQSLEEEAERRILIPFSDCEEERNAQE